MIREGVIEKRTHDDVLYDIRCAALLRDGETIETVTTIEADEDVGLTIDAAGAQINATEASYDYGETAAAGTVIQVRIGGGEIPAGRRDETRRVDNVLVTLRARFATSEGNSLEATVQLLLMDDLP